MYSGGGSATALISHIKDIMTTRKAITLGLLTTAVVTLLAFGIKYKAFKTTTPNANKRVEVRADNTLTDLTNTKWYFNDTLTDFTPNGYSMKQNINVSESYKINYTSNNITGFSYVRFLNPTNANYASFDYGTPQQNGTWYSYNTNTWKAVRDIQIIDGQDATNTKLINWFKNNATQITVTDLTNTSWKINETLDTISSGYLNASINFYNNGHTQNSLQLGYQANNIATANAISFSGSYEVYYNSQWTGHSIEQTYRQSSRIQITGGSQATNLKLITWLTLNAEQYEQIQTTLNTKWTFVDHPYSTNNNTRYDDILFTSNKKSCNGLLAGNGANNIIAYAFKVDNNSTTPYTYNQVYDGTYWVDTNFQTIIIVGGEDQDSLSLISYLVSNAEGVAYQPIPNNADQYDIENGNFVSLQSLMIQILTMPFTFISQAFNITLWPNTAWEFNLSNFILGIIAIASLIFIIKLFTSGFSVIGNFTREKDNREFKKSQTQLNKAKTEKIKKETDKK